MAMLNNQRVFHRFMGIFTGEIPIKTTFSGGMVPFTPWFQTSQSSKGPASFVAPPGDPVHCRKGTRRWHIWRRVPSKTSWFSKDIFLFFSMTYDVSKIFPRFCLHIIFFPHHFPMDFMIVPMEISTSFSHETSIFRWVFPHLFDSKSQEPHRNNFRPCKVCLCGKSQVEMAEIFHGKIPGKTLGKWWFIWKTHSLRWKITIFNG